MATGKNASDHKGGRGDQRAKTAPKYPQGPERVASTKPSPNYPRSNFKSGRSK